MKINLKLIVILLEIALIPLTIVTFVAYSSAKSEIDSQIESKLVAEADIQKNRFENRIKENTNTLDLLTHDPDIIHGVENYVLSPTAASRVVLERSLSGETNFLSGVRRVSFSGLNGVIFASTDPKYVGKNISALDYFIKGKTADSTTDFSKDANGLISLNLAGPVFLNGKTVGVLIIDSDGSNITSVVTDYTGLGDTGETLLVTKNANGDAMFLTPVRFDPNAALNRVITAGSTNVPSTHAVKGEEITMLNATDYNGYPVIAVTRYIPAANWGIVAKISQSEAYAPTVNLRNLLVFMVIISTATILVITYSVARSFTDPVVNLTNFAKKVGLGDLTKRAAVGSKDEIGQLSKSLNEMIESLLASRASIDAKVAEQTKEILTKSADMQDQQAAILNILEDVNTEKTKYEALLTGIADGIIATDSETNIIVINPAAEMILGLKKDEVLGKKLVDILPVTNREGNLVAMSDRPFNKALSTMKSFSTSVDSNYYFTKKDGTKIPVALNASPVISEGRLIGVIDVFRDISHEKDVDRMKTEFVSLSSHQLRTPLTAIKWGLEAFIENDTGNLNATQKEELDDIQSSTLRMIDLVNSLLNVSRIESGRIAVSPQPTNLVTLANDVVSRLKMQLNQKNITLVMNVEGNPPEIPLDAKLVSNVYQNLLTNSIFYSPEGSKITLSILEKDGEVISSVKDEGIGIPETEKAKLFTKFYRTSNAIKTRPDGSGLGLYIVKSIVESSGGKIWFDSLEGKGSTFYFSLPLTGMKAKEGEVSLT